MKAFGLPSFSEGYVRINLEGREAAGIVAPCEYEAVCAEIIAHLLDLRNARTGKPVVRKVVRTRGSAAERGAKLPDADLVICWESEPADVVDSTAFGRIGPFPYNRSGSHVESGFIIASGPGIPARHTLPDGNLPDLAPTILQLMGAPAPSHLRGRPLVRVSDAPATV